MHQRLQKLFDEHQSPSHAGTHHVHLHAMPVVRLNAMIQKQVLEYEALLEEATMDPEHHPDLTPKLEAIRQTLGALKRDAAAAQQAFSLVRMAMEQLDRYMPEARMDVEHILDGIAAKRGAPDPASAAPSVAVETVQSSGTVVS